MSDASGEQPQKPNFSRPAPSLWETFAKNRVDKPRNIEIEEGSKVTQTTPVERSIEEVQRELTGEYLNVFHKYRGDEDCLSFVNEDIEVSFWGDEGRWVEGVPENWNPEKLTMDIQSLNGAIDNNERMHRKWYRGQQVPEFFRIGKCVFRIVSIYHFDPKEGLIKRKDELIPLATGSILPNSDFSKAGLEDLSESAKQRLNLSEEEVQELSKGWRANLIDGGTNELGPDDYELLKSVLIAIKTGKVTKTVFEDNEDKSL